MRLADCRGFALGLVLGWVLIGDATLALAPTAVTWDASSCPAGVYSIETTARGTNGDTQTLTRVGVTLPAPTYTESFPNLLQQSYTVSARVLQGGIAVSQAQSQTRLGLGDALPPVVTPTPTPTVTPVPTSTPTPGQQSPNCTKATTVTDAGGGVWTLGPNGEIVRSGQPVPGIGSQYFYAAGVVYVLGTDSQWYRRDSQAWIPVGPADPSCALPPVQTTVDLTPVLTALQQQTVILGQLKTAIAALAPTPPSTANCVVTSVNSASVTCRATRSDFASVTVGQALKVIK